MEFQVRQFMQLCFQRVIVGHTAGMDDHLGMLLAHGSTQPGRPFVGR